MKILDNADGKQARRTNNSTALGLLMDHGADCLNTGLSTMAFLQIINPSLGWCYLAFLLLYQIFFYVTLEEYYFGSLDFPIINAVNEGTTSTFLILMIGVVMGNGVYQQEVFYGFKFYEIIFGTIIFAVIIQNLVTLIKLFVKFKFLDVLWKNFIFTIASISYTLVVLLSSNSVVTNRPKIVMYIYTVVFSRIIISMMISHIFHSNFDQLQVFPLAISLLMVLLVAIEKLFISGNKSPALTSESNQVYLNYVEIAYFLVFFFSTKYIILYIASIIGNFSKILNIKVLSINPPPPEKDIETPLESEEGKENATEMSISKAQSEKISNAQKAETDVKYVFLNNQRKSKKAKTKWTLHPKFNLKSEYICLTPII